jgi:hypothetical protein
MKPMLSFSTMGVCLIFFFLTVPIAGAQEEVVANNLELSQEDKIAAEKEMLEAKIAELEEKPLDYFGSQKNKRVRIGYYRYRLEALNTDPDKYFSQPSQFQGNVKSTE